MHALRARRKMIAMASRDGCAMHTPERVGCTAVMHSVSLFLCGDLRVKDGWWQPVVSGLS